MKKVTLIICAILLLFIEATTDKQLKDFTKVSDKIYLYNFEVSVDEYYQFLKEKNYRSSLLPDSSVFSDTVIFGNQIIPFGFSKEYFSDKYGKYPIVGVSRSQAAEYCKWLLFTGKIKGNVKDVRLPTLNEYYSALYQQPIIVEYRPNDDLKIIRTNELDDNQYTDLCHYSLRINNNRFTDNIQGYQDGYIYYCPVNNFSINQLNHLLGNVSEIVSVSSNSWVAIGNNFTGKIQYPSLKLGNPFILTYDENLIKQQDFNKASAKVGFRYIVEFK